MNQLIIDRVLETALHVEDIGRSAEFYIRVLGFPVLERDDRRMCALNVSGRQVLLLFKRGETAHPVQTDGGIIPPHGGNGQLHFAFAIATAQYDLWKKHLLDLGIPIESEVRWPPGGRSLYFRDPDNHCVELATPGTWATY